MEKKCGVLHGDISPFNLVIVHLLPFASDGDIAVPDGVNGNVQSFGSPIDYDYSCKCGEGTAHVLVNLIVVQINSLN